MYKKDCQQQQHIRSFVQRARRLTAKRQQIFSDLSTTYILDAKNGPLDYQKIFNRQAPTILEIGFGMGDLLWQMLNDQPEKNFIGIEVHQPGVARLLEKLQAEPHNNIRIYNADALIILEQCIPDNSLEKILLFFPDPWPKRSQHKRRIVRPEFAQLLYKKLKSHGTFQMLTDCQDYAEHSKKILQHMPEHGEVAFQENGSTEYVTKFSQRARLAGQKIFEVIFIKR